MAWRQLPDGSWFDQNTGQLRGTDEAWEAREAQGRAIAIRRGQYRPKQAPRNQPGPHPPTPTQTMVALPQTRGVQAIIEPQANLAVNPYELGMGRQGGMGMLGTLTDTQKRMLAIAGVVGAAFGVVWLEKKFGSSAAKKA